MLKVETILSNITKLKVLSNSDAISKTTKGDINSGRTLFWGVKI